MIIYFQDRQPDQQNAPQQALLQTHVQITGKQSQQWQVLPNENIADKSHRLNKALVSCTAADNNNNNAVKFPQHPFLPRPLFIFFQLLCSALLRRPLPLSRRSLLNSSSMISLLYLSSKQYPGRTEVSNATQRPIIDHGLSR